MQCRTRWRILLHKHITCKLHHIVPSRIIDFCIKSRYKRYFYIFDTKWIIYNFFVFHHNSIWSGKPYMCIFTVFYCNLSIQKSVLAASGASWGHRQVFRPADSSRAAKEGLMEGSGAKICKAWRLKCWTSWNLESWKLHKISRSWILEYLKSCSVDKISRFQDSKILNLVKISWFKN